MKEYTVSIDFIMSGKAYIKANSKKEAELIALSMDFKELNEKLLFDKKVTEVIEEE